MKINALSKTANDSEVRRFYDTAEIRFRGLQSLSADPNTYETVLVDLLLQKLHKEFQQIISRKLSNLHGYEKWLILLDFFMLFHLSPTCIDLGIPL